MRPFAPCFASTSKGPRLYLTDHRRCARILVPSSRPLLKTLCFTPCKLWSDAVPESTLSGAQRSDLNRGERLETTLRNLWRQAFILTVWS